MTETDRPTVAFVLPIGLTLGGSNTWSVKLAEYLAARGGKTALIEHTCVEWHPRWNVAIPAGVRHVLCPGPTPVEAGEQDVGAFAEVYRTVLPAILIPNYSAAAYAACARLASEAPDRVRLIGVGHGHDESFMSLLRHYEPIIHLFIAKNPTMAAVLRDMLPGRHDDIVTRGYAVDVPPRLQRGYSAPDKPLRLAYAGRITNHQKRVSNLVPLARILDGLGVDFTLRIIGEGGYKNWLCHEVSELPPELQRRIQIEQMMLPDALTKAWQETDVCLLVSDTESGGISMLEAMAQGCVPVSTRTPGPSSIVSDGEDGFLVDIEDMQTMAQRIQALASNRGQLEAVGKRAYAKVQQSLSYEAYVPWFEQVLERVWAGKPRPWDGSRTLMPAVARGKRRLGATAKGLILRRILDSRFNPHRYLLGNPFKILEHEELVRRLNFSREDVVVDVGCGGGYQTALFARRAGRVVGIDISSGAIGRAKSDHSQFLGRLPIEFLCTSLEAAGFREASVDKVFAVCVLEHVEGYESVLRECHRILKPGGVLRLSVDSLANVGEDVRRRHARLHDVKQYFEPEALKQDVEHAGFVDVSVTPLFRSDLAARLFSERISSDFQFRLIESVKLAWKLRIHERCHGACGRGLFLIVKARRQ